MSIPRFLCAFLLLGAALFSAGCASSKKSEGPVALVRFMLEAQGGQAASIARLPKSGTAIPLEPKSHFTEYDIVNCSVVDNELGKSLVFQLTPQAGRDLYRLTASNQGKRLVAVLNGRPIGARPIERPFDQGYIVTYVEVDDELLEELAKDITRTSLEEQEELEKRTR